MKQNFHWIQRIWLITEAWIWLNLKILSLTVSCWHCGSILVSCTRGGRFEPFHCNDKYFCHWIQWKLQCYFIDIRGNKNLQSINSATIYISGISELAIHKCKKVWVCFSSILSQRNCDYCFDELNQICIKDTTDKRQRRLVELLSAVNGYTHSLA